MNFYDFHIGDYATRTGHLEPMEDLAYRRLLDLYYTREESLPADVQEIARLARLRQNVAEVESVLKEFFQQEEDGRWVHAHCEEVIAAYRAKSKKASESAGKRWSERIAIEVPMQCERNANALPTQCEGNAPSPTTQSQSFSLRSKGKRASAPPCPEDVNSQVWADWLELRRKKRAPVTETVVASAREEAQKAGMTFGAFLCVWCRRGSQGLEADWLKPHERASPQGKSFRERDAEAAQEVGRKWMGSLAKDVIDMEVPNAAQLPMD